MFQGLVGYGVANTIEIYYYRGFRCYEVHLKPLPRTPLNPPAAGGGRG